MIGVAIGLIIVGIVFLFVVPWVGIAVGVIGLILLIGFLLGFGRVPRRRNVSDRST
jgi:Flp pilus assembly protein TadB